MTQHNPGSPQAAKQGCTCDPKTNHNGVGEPFNDGANHRWTIALYCPVHSEFKRIAD